MEVEKRGKGGFLQLFDWNGKSRKKLFTVKPDLPGILLLIVTVVWSYCILVFKRLFRYCMQRVRTKEKRVVMVQSLHDVSWYLS